MTVRGTHNRGGGERERVARLGGPSELGLILRLDELDGSRELRLGNTEVDEPGRYSSQCVRN
jgi:hypothetical protein